MRVRRIALVLLALLAALAPGAADAALVYVTGPPGREAVALSANDGSGAKRLGPGLLATVAPDGSAVAVYRFGPGPRAAPRLYVVGADGAARLLSRACTYTAVWSPDSRRLVCEAGDPRDRLLLIDVESGRARVLDRAAGFSGVSFSPAGHRVAWGRQRTASGLVYDVDVAPVEGVGRRRLVVNAMNPAWGPRLIAVTRIRPRGPSSFPLYNVWLLRPDGSGLRQLTHRTEPQLIGGLVPVQWSADGSRLLAERGGQDYSEAYRIDPRTGAASDLTGRDDGVVGWALSADGRAVLATRGGYEPTTANDVVVIPWGGGRARVLARHATAPSWTR